MQLDNLQSIFNKRLFRIPDYQRGYSWNEKQLNALWNDIDILQDGKDHYTGVLSVAPKKDSIHIVDGQQRISTLIILIQVICDAIPPKKRINGKEKADYVKKYLHYKTGKQGDFTEVIFGYDQDNPSHFYFKTEILGLTDTDNVAESLYTENLKQAKEFFTDKVKHLNFKQLEQLLKKVTEHLKFNYYKINDELNEFVIFETMNDRGKDLSDFELLKNRLIYLSTLLPDNDDKEKNALRKNIKDAWKTAYEFLGKNPKAPLTDDDFLKDHWIMNFKYSRKESKVYKNVLLNEHFTAIKVLDKQRTLQDIRDYVLDIQDTVKSYYYLHNPQDSSCPYSEDIKKWLSKLQRLGCDTFKPLITSILTKGWGQPEQTKIVRILECVERFIFVAFHVQFYRTNYENGTVYKKAHQFHSAPSTQNWDSIRNELSLEGLEVKSNLSKDDFLDAIHKKYEEKGFYGWSGLEYFLYEYELHLQEAKQGDVKVIWEKITSETIEHIYPQNPKDGWKAFKSIRGKSRNRFLHDLGNLLLLSGRKNSALQNKPFKQKQEHAEHGYSNSSYSAIEVAKNKDWTPDTISQRTNHLFNFLREHWNIKDDIWTIGHPDNDHDDDDIPYTHPDNRFMGKGHTKKAPCWLKYGDRNIQEYTRKTEAEKMIRKIGGDPYDDLYSSEHFEDLDSE